jgi:hypothetical protein
MIILTALVIVIVAITIAIIMARRNGSRTAISATTTPNISASGTGDAGSTPSATPTSAISWSWQKIAGTIFVGVLVAVLVGLLWSEASNENSSPPATSAVAQQISPSSVTGLSAEDAKILADAKKGTNWWEVMFYLTYIGCAAYGILGGKKPFLGFLMLFALFGWKALGTDHWIIVPIVLVTLACYVIFFTEAKIGFAGILALIVLGFAIWYFQEWFIPTVNTLNKNLGIPAISSFGESEDASPNNTRSSIEKRSLARLWTPSDPVEIDVVITKFHQDVCDNSLPNGKHTVTATQMELRMITQNNGAYAGNKVSVPSILGNQTGGVKEDLPYQKVDYHFGILFNNKPSGSEIKIQNHCIKDISFNIPSAMEKYYNLKTQTNTLHLTVQ